MHVNNSQSKAIVQEFKKAETVLKHLNGNAYTFRPLPQTPDYQLIPHRDLGHCTFIAFAITLFIMTDYACHSIFSS